MLPRTPVAFGTRGAHGRMFTQAAVVQQVHNTAQEVRFHQENPSVATPVGGGGGGASGTNAGNSKPQRVGRVLIQPDSVSSAAIAQARSALMRTFTRYVLLAAVLGLGVAGVTVAQAVIAPWWTLYFRVFALVRASILCVFAVLCCSNPRGIQLHRLYGTGEESQALIALRPLPLLAAWRILGYVDVNVGRIVPIVIDVASVALDPHDATVAETAIRLGIGFAVLIEYFVSVWLVHKRGIWKNVRDKLLLQVRQV